MRGFLQTYVRTWPVQFLVMLALWFAFVAKTEMAEVVIGIAAAALAATGDAAIRRRLARFSPRPGWLLEVWRLPGYIVQDTAVVFRVLIRRLVLQKEPDSVLRSIAFDAGGHSARSSARRALALGFMTMPPNSIVIGIDQEKDSMLVHQLAPSDVPEMAKRLGAK
ncbi:MAG TPA: hypothetical protein VGK48_12495 [Terriglobia bacterium]|jgi:multisubunit Na+/H+ antiporter MnhE subunit